MNARHLSSQSLLRNAVLAAVVALIVNFIIRLIAVSLFDADPTTGPMSWTSLITVTLGVIAVATGVYWLLSRRSENPVGTFRLISIIVLILSLSGPLLTPDLDTPSHVAGALMHIVVAGSVITLLPRSSAAHHRVQS